MYPTIEVFGITFYSFGFISACTWFLSVILLHRFSWKKGITKPVFSSIIPLTLSAFLFARIFFIMAEWREQKYILMDFFSGQALDALKLFVMPQEFFLSLFGGIFGFMLAFLLKTSHTEKENRLRYIDVIVYTFLLIMIPGYFGALLGGQVYGIPYSGPLSILYDHKDSIVKDRSSLFPLPLLGVILSYGTYFFLTKFEKKNPGLPDGFIGFLGISIFFSGMFLMEFLSGTRKDMFYDLFSLSLNQLGSLILVIIAALGIGRILKKHSL